MIAQAEPRDVARTARLLRVDPRAWAMRDLPIDSLADQFADGDLVVVNDAATLPASFAATTCAGASVEIRLAGPIANGKWAAVVFGEGDWRTRTEQRPEPAPVRKGCRIEMHGLAARVARISSVFFAPRRARVRGRSRS
jgi:S-adenosylmethionine:tRNA ribosyltransferase-isomerase